jgi:hypothetical protein
MLETSPFADYQSPSWLNPFVETIYRPPVFLAKKLGKDQDQAVYLISSVAAIICGFILKNLKGETPRKIFSTAMGLLIHFYMYGITAFVSIAQNLLVYVLIATLPS